MGCDVLRVSKTRFEEGTRRDNEDAWAECAALRDTHRWFVDVVQSVFDLGSNNWVPAELLNVVYELLGHNIFSEGLADLSVSKSTKFHLALECAAEQVEPLRSARRIARCTICTA